MKIEFRTIAIGHLVLNYVILFGLALLAQLYYPSDVYIWFLFLGPVVLYFLHRGKVKLEIKGEKLLIHWSNPPVINAKPNREISLNDIIRWKYERSVRGPDNFVLILENGERVQIRPGMFSMRDLESELFRSFTDQMKAHHAATPKEKLQALIINSNYLRKLNGKLKVLDVSIKAAITLGSTLLMALIFVEGRMQDLVSGSFLFFFVISILMFVYSKYLQMEKEQTIAADYQELG